MAKKRKPGPGGREVATAYKLLVVQERMKGASMEDVAAAFGVSVAAVQKWTNAFRRHGPSALESKRGRSGKVGLRKLRGVKEEQVVALKKKNETWGTRRISDVLARFEGLGVSETQVRRILHEAGLIESPPEPKEREHGPRRFERATPNQLWQSDIFTFRLRRAERLYVCVFMDDHSRYIVGHSLAHHQKSALVMEAFERGVAAYGAPTEVLTDNGRQYTVWRGKTEFEEHLQRLGVQHIRSRPQHPQTLGKVERFWKTLWDEFLGRTVFAHVVDAQRRLEHYISHYNLQRPHQALDGLVPADRFFKMAAHVRAEIERNIVKNELRLAFEQPPRKPFYVVGQLGDQQLSIAAGATGLEVHVGGKSETIPLKEDEHATSTSRRFTEEEEASEPTDTEMAHAAVGGGQPREEPYAPRPVGPLGREARDDGDRGSWDLSRLLLPTGDEGTEWDDRGAGAGRGRERESRYAGPASAAAGSAAETREGRGGAATRGADARDPSQAGAARTAEDPAWASAEDDNALDAWWEQKLALLDDDDADQHNLNDAIDEAAGCVPLGELGWRERGPERWERKLAGADAAGDNVGDGEETDVHAGAGASGGSGTAPPLRGDHRGALGTTDGDGRSELAGAVAPAFPDDPAQGDRRDHRGDYAETGGEAGEATGGGGTRSRERETASGSGSATDSDGVCPATLERRRWTRVGQDATAENAREEDQARGPRACDGSQAGGDDDA
jgi:transposase InsO family protein